MDFIESWLGVSPDGGSGRLEITLILVALAVLGASFLIIKVGRRRSNSQKLTPVVK